MEFLGTRNAYSIPEMCQDDIALFQLIKDRNGAAAVRRWNAKMNAATTYMVQQLNPTKPYLR